ncbi:hypothetical protein QJS04_geneDACA014304 [Acorus gramineus]|uniref:DNA-3-methyladenine glycosylase I n=1 Tax=Acorus gramineus TaxID=55184 RepID=A0AAV9BWC1_ACOGR|nr:hypothetical protein QJS04_geneDACA014304 [Acorus gramineus]
MSPPTTSLSLSLYIHPFKNHIPPLQSSRSSPFHSTLETSTAKETHTTHTTTTITTERKKERMCSSKTKSPLVAHIDRRRVLQPACNRVVVPLTFQNYVPLKKPFTIETMRDTVKRIDEPNILNYSNDKPLSSPKLVGKKKPKKLNIGSAVSLESSVNSSTSFSSSTTSSLDAKAPGSIAAARREEATMRQAERKMKIAHYGRTMKAKVVSAPPVVVVVEEEEVNNGQEEKRCSFITSNSDPMYVAYHDEEWGVPVHDDKVAFSGFDAEIVSRFSERRIASVSAQCSIDLGKVRGVIDNAKRILEVQNTFGSLQEYLWGFVNYKPIATQYKSCRKIPVKTSKSESISKELVKRGFRYVGPTVIHSFMQAAGLTNDHLLTCPRRHLHCSSS